MHFELGSEAKSIVYGHPVWAAERESLERFHDFLEKELLKDAVEVRREGLNRHYRIDLK